MIVRAQKVEAVSLSGGCHHRDVSEILQGCCRQVVDDHPYVLSTDLEAKTVYLQGSQQLYIDGSTRIYHR